MQADQAVANGSGAVVRADINAQIEALVTNSSGTSAPSVTWPYQWWADTTNGLLKIRNGANTAWGTVASWDGTSWIPYRSGTALGTAATKNTGTADDAVPTVDDLATLMRGYIDGLEFSNNAVDANNDLDVSEGVVCAYDQSTMIILPAGLTKRLDAAWAVGDGSGGLDTGSKAINTTYWAYAIRRSDTGVVDILLSASATSPTMPANYDQRSAPIAAFLTDGSGNIRGFVQDGDLFLLKSEPGAVYVSNLGTTAVLYDLVVPVGKPVIAICGVSASNASSGFAIVITSPDQNDIAATQSLTLQAGNAGDFASGQVRTRTNSSGQIRARSTAASTTFFVGVEGWILGRGKNE